MTAPDPSRVPTFVKHVTLAILNKPLHRFARRNALIPKAVGESSERFLQAFITAVNGLRQQGFVTRGSTAKPSGYIALTERGSQRDRIHTNEGPDKSSRFDSLYLTAFREVRPKAFEPDIPPVAPRRSPAKTKPAPTKSTKDVRGLPEKSKKLVTRVKSARKAVVRRAQRTMKRR